MRFTLVIVFTFFAMMAHSQIKYTLNGAVKDSLTGEALIGAYISVPETHSGCVTNAYGFYSLTLPTGTYNIR